MISLNRSRICRVPSTPEAFGIRLWSGMYQQHCHISPAWRPWTPVQMGCGRGVGGGVGLGGFQGVDIYEGVRVPVEAEKFSAFRWRVLEDLLFSLGFCQVGSMFGDVLGLLVFLLAATFLLCFLASLLFRACTVNSLIPPTGLLLPLVFLGRHAHIFKCLGQTGLHLFPYLFCLTTTSDDWDHFCNESLLVETGHQHQVTIYMYGNYKRKAWVWAMGVDVGVGMGRGVWARA